MPSHFGGFPFSLGRGEFRLLLRPVLLSLLGSRRLRLGKSCPQCLDLLLHLLNCLFGLALAEVCSQGCTAALQFVELRSQSLRCFRYCVFQSSSSAIKFCAASRIARPSPVPRPCA